MTEKEIRKRYDKIKIRRYSYDAVWSDRLLTFEKFMENGQIIANLLGAIVSAKRTVC